MSDVLQFGKDIPCHISTFNRPNISYEVRYKDSLDNSNKTSAILNLMETIVNEHKKAKRKDNAPCSGIIYVHKRNDTNMLVHQIQMLGITAAPYHAGLKDKERKEIQEKWTCGEIKVAVATVAFGMGIDLPHVRYVVHWSIAKTLEGFYQESGRGGRDGKPSKSIIYYAKSDESLFAFLIQKNNEKKDQTNQHKHKKSPRSRNEDPNLVALQRMVDYCKQAGCRRQFLLQHFGEKIEPKEVCKGTCDYCKNPALVEKSIQGSYASIAAKHIKKQNAFFKKSQSSNDWNGTHGEFPDDDNIIDQWDDTIDAGNGQLGITKGNSSIDYLASDKNANHKLKGGFMTAKDTLAKYEALECQVGNRNGFVKFKAKASTTTSIRKKLLGNLEDIPAEEKQTSSTFVGIPQHLRSKLPDPLQSLSHKKSHGVSPKKKKDSTQIASEIERLKADLAALKQKRESIGARKSDTTATVPTNIKGTTSAPPPPTLSFRQRRRRHK